MADAVHRDLMKKLFDEELGIDTFEEADGTSTERADGTALMVVRAFSEASRRGYFERGYRRALDVARMELPPARRQVEICRAEGAPGAATVRRMMAAVADEASRTFHRQLPGYEWLWMIRRFPLRPMWGDQGAVNLRVLMSSLALSGTPSAGRFYPGGIIPVDRERGRRLAFLAGFAAAVAHFEMAYRWIGKNGCAVIDFANGWVEGSGRDALHEALRDYDRQVTAEGGWGGLGIHIPEVSNIAQQHDQPGDGPILLMLWRLQALWTGGPQRDAMRLERYAERFVHLDEVFELLAHPYAPSAEAFDGELGVTLPLLMAYRKFEADGNITTANVRMVGYSVHRGVSLDDPGVLEGGLGQALAEAGSRLPGLVPQDVRSLWRGIKALRPSITPRRVGPAVAPMEPRGIVIDWYAISMRFLTTLRYPPMTGAAANARGASFEQTVRTAIAHTPCKPVGWLEQLVGRQLRHAGQQAAFGEIDAGATLPGGDVHLVVSCKSYPYSEEYERGEYRAVRNIGQRLVADVNSALVLVRELSANREGANYKIPAGAVLVPVVVTPRPMFVADEICRKRWFNDDWGPRILSGVGGLISYLSGYELEAE